MPKIEEFQLRPLGWEDGPEEERFKVSTLDYLSAMTWNNYTLFFKLDDAEKRFVCVTPTPRMVSSGPIRINTRQQSGSSPQGRFGTNPRSGEAAGRHHREG